MAPVNRDLAATHPPPHSRRDEHIARRDSERQPIAAESGWQQLFVESFGFGVSVWNGSGLYEQLTEDDPALMTRTTAGVIIRSSPSS